MYAGRIIRICSDCDTAGIHISAAFRIVIQVIYDYRIDRLIQRHYIDGKVTAHTLDFRSVHSRVGNYEITDRGRRIRPGQRIILHYSVYQISYETVTHVVAGVGSGNGVRYLHSHSRTVIDHRGLRTVGIIRPFGYSGRVRPIEHGIERRRNIAVQQLYFPGYGNLFYEYYTNYHAFGYFVEAHGIVVAARGS